MLDPTRFTGKLARVNSITRLRVHSDGQGVRSLIFLQGCPLHCFWCCNPETRFSRDYQTLSQKALFSCIEKDLPYFRFSGGGITFSGGEPLAQGRFLRSFIRNHCRDIPVDVETSLFAPTAVVRDLIPLIHEWNVDFKIFSEEKHRQYTGSSNGLILTNLRLLASQVPADRIMITVPLIPGYNDTDENLLAMTAFLRELGLSRIELHPYRKFAEDKQRRVGLSPTEISPLTADRLSQIRNLLQEQGMVLERRHGIYGKEKCVYLKSLRKEACRRYQLPVEIIDCTYTGPCIGTCPRCESELEEIAARMNEQERMGNSCSHF